MGYAISQGNASEPLLFLLVLSADHVSPATGKSPTVAISKNGGAFASPVGAVAEVGNGWYSVAANATDANTLGPLLLHATATASDPTDEQYDVVNYTPTALAGQTSSSGIARSALDLIKAATKSIGYLAAGETLDPDDADDAFQRLNALIDAWATERLLIYEVRRTTKVLAANVSSYTIGAGGSINIARPLWIDHAGLILNTSLPTPYEVPIPVFTDQQWQGLGLKTFTASQPQGIFYDYSFTGGMGLIQPWPVPTVGTTLLVLYVPQQLLQFANLAAGYLFPPAYERMIRLNLAVELADEFGKALTPRMDQRAAEAVAQVKRANFRPDDLGLDFPGRRHLYNIFTDQ